MKAVELYYTVAELCLLVKRSDKTICAQLKTGDFGADVVNLGTEERPDYRVPASGVNAYLDARRLFLENVKPGIPARSIGELRRKATITSTGS